MTSKGMKYINNGIIQKMIHPEDELPEGFVFGKLPISEKTRKILSESHKGIKPSEESIKKMKQTFLERYGVSSPSQLAGVSKKISDKLSSKEVQDKMKKTNLERYGVESVLANKEINAKMRATNLSRHGDANYNNKEKEYETRKRNNTLGLFETAPEKELFSLLKEAYGDDNVYRQYRTKEYPFKADFYIKSLNTYIEYNGYFTHKDHIFNNFDDEDILEKERLEQLKLNGDRWASNILYTWTNLDVRKNSYRDKINLIMFYPDKQDDIVSSFKKLKAELDSYQK